MADQGFGTTLTFSGGFAGEIKSIQIGGVSRDALETTYMATTQGYRTFIPSDLVDPGELSVEVQFEADKNFLTPIKGAVETVTITFPIESGHSNAGSYACSGFLTEFEVTSQFDEIMTANLTIKYTGVPTYTPAS